MDAFWLCAVPLFVAVDAIGVLPMFISLTEGVDRTRVRKIILQSMLTAGSVAVVFVLAGPAVLSFLGITVPDFMMAGGLLLLVISLSDILTGEKRQRKPDAESLGAVPIGVPLICGPAVLATCLLLSSTHGKMITTVALLLNILLAGLVFLFARPLTAVLGRTGSKTISKVASLLLAAIAVMLIRKGVAAAITGGL